MELSAASVSASLSSKACRLVVLSSGVVLCRFDPALLGNKLRFHKFLPRSKVSFGLPDDLEHLVGELTLMSKASSFFKGKASVSAIVEPSAQDKPVLALRCDDPPIHHRVLCASEAEKNALLRAFESTAPVQVKRQLSVSYIDVRHSYPKSARRHVTMIKTPMGTGLTLSPEDVVTAIKADSQAERVGIQLGDQVLAINGEDASMVTPAPEIVQRLPIGTTLDFTLAHG